ncbi:MAG TPA: hypothetical protein VJU84_12850, partial [Pyrinomonadaceae bacterium]|nr:hypothetical protein [Pyrinomonadaceae bacterium]
SIDSNIAEKMVTSWSQKKSGRLFNLPQVIENYGEPWRARTSDPLIKSAVTGTPAGYGSYDLLTFVTGCSRQRVHLLPAISAYFSVFWSQVGHKGMVQQFLVRAKDYSLNHVASFVRNFLSKRVFKSVRRHLT